MEIHLIRHTEVELSPGICYGQSEVPLRESFAIDAEKYHALREIKFDQIYTSPATRCLRLAHHLNYQTAIPEPRILEFHFGDWEMRNWSEIPPTELNPWMENFDTAQVPGGESYVQMYARVCQFYESLKSQPMSRVLWITHAGVIRCMWARLLGISLKNSFKVPVGYGEHMIFDSTHETILKKS